jgi:membrane-bound lytic murein transglycosylase F
VAVLLTSGATRAADLEAIRARGTLRVLTILDNEVEFISKAKDGYTGFDYEILEGFAQLERVKLEIIPSSGWDRLVPDLLDGRGDMIAGRFTDTPARRKWIDFTVEVFPTRNVVVTRSPHRVVTTLEELRSERISITHGASMVDALLAAGVPRANIDDTIPSGGLPPALESGAVTCTVHEIQTAIVTQRRDPKIQLGLFIGPPASLAYGVPKGSPQLLHALDEYILNLRRTSTWNRLVVKYLGDAALDVLHRARGE